MAEKTNAPEIRFEGFTDPWEQRKLGNCGTTYGGLTGKTKEDFGHGNARFIPYTNVFDNPLTDTKRLEAVEIDSSQNQVAYGDVFFTVSSETPDEVGMSSVWLSDQEDVYLNSFCFGYRQDSTFDPHYLAYMLRSSSVRSNLTLLAQGISRFNISKNKVMELSVPVPSAVEQKQLGQYFTKLDSLITLHQRKYDKLCTVKKSMLDKMFPKPGETEPEIRFEGFTDPWEQRKLGDITSSYSGGTPQANNPDYYNGSIPFIRSAEINADKTELYLTERGLAESSAALVDAGCILYALYGATSGEAGISRINGAINQAILAICPYAGFDSGFLASWLRREKDAIVATYLQGGQGNLSGAIVKDLRVPVPGLPEQKAIGDCLSKLDDLITLHRRKLNILKNTKKSLLDKMFV